MHSTVNIDYHLALSIFNEAEQRNNKLVLGNMDTTIWLHKENLNFDFVIHTAKKFTDSRIFIIANGTYKGFYIYSHLKKTCVKLIETSSIHEHAHAI